MTKSQFNIKISKDLLTQIKRQATMSGKSLTEHITDLVIRSLEENNLNNDNINYSERIKCFEQRLLSIESIVKNREYISPKLKPFTDEEAINCSKFMRGVFDKEASRRNFDNQNEAFDDFVKCVDEYSHLSQSFTNRLKEIMIEKNARPWTGKELNDLNKSTKCNCPIRKGLIEWTGNIDCPSQQEICDKGEKLLTLL